jgi:protein-tyrosine phosphatase
MNCSMIQPSVWVGPEPRDEDDFRYLQALKITAILSLQDEEDRGQDGIEEEGKAAAGAGIVFENVQVKDFSVADLQLRLPACVAALEKLAGQGHTVYVHCTAGVNRSPTVVIAYLHWCCGWELEHALEQVQKCRPCAPSEEAIRNARRIGR